MNIHEIKDALLNKRKAIFNLNEIAREINTTKKIASVYVNRMLKKKLIRKIEKNKVSLTDDIFIIASQLIFPAYISLTTSLYLNNFSTQITRNIYVITAKKKKTLIINGSKIIFIKVKPSWMFGYKKIEKEDSFILIADKEKTLIDCLKFPRYCRLNEIKEYFKEADLNKIERYLENSNEVIIARMGYILDTFNIKHKLKRKTTTIYKLNPTIKKNGIYNNKWRIYINDNVN